MTQLQRDEDEAERHPSTTGGKYIRLFACTLLVAFVATAANATPTKPSVADQIRHPGQQVAYGNCQTTCQYYNQWTHQTVCQQHCF